MTQQLKSIQALRGLACLAVMAYHFRATVDSQFPGAGSALFAWGETGVDLFFILSGFVITLSTARIGHGAAAAGDFLKRRALRLLPAYFILLLVNFIFAGGMANLHYADKVASIISAATLTVSSVLNGPYYIEQTGFFGVRWTLNYEYWFYLMMTAALLFRARWLALAGMLCLTLLLMPLASGQPLTLNTQGYAFAHTYFNLISNPIIWEFAAGVLIGLLYPYALRLPLSLRAALLAAATLLLVTHLVRGSQVGHGLLASGSLLALLLAAVALNDGWLGRITPRWLVLIGDISFSVYLIHIVTMRQVERHLHTGGVALFAAAIVTSLLAGWLSWRYIEPLGQKIARRRAEKRALKPTRAA